MTPTLGSWLNWNSGADLEEWQQQAVRSSGVEFIINKNAVLLILDRSGTQLDEQTVMITGVASLAASASERGSDTGTAVTAQVMVLFKEDGDVQRGDRFTYNAYPVGRLNYEITRVEKAFAGMIQTFAEIIA